MRFTGRFYGRMAIFAGIFTALANILLQTGFDRVTIDHESSLTVWFIVLPVIFAAATSAFCTAMAVHHTNILRRYEWHLKDGREKAFYIIFAAVLILITAADTAFLLGKLMPIIDRSLAFAVRDAQIRNATPEIEASQIADLNTRAEGYRRLAKFMGGAVLLIKSTVYIIAAPKLIKVYRDPPDFWSGKKKGQKIKRI